MHGRRANRPSSGAIRFARLNVGTGEAYELYTGPLTLHSDELAIEGEGTISFRWRPSPKVWFTFGSDSAPAERLMDFTLRSTITGVDLPNDVPVADPFERETTELKRHPGDWAYTNSGNVPLPWIELGTSTDLARVRFALINFTEHSLPRHQREAPFSDFLDLEVPPWHLHLESITPDRDWVDEVKQSRGYVPTHWLDIERLDGATFDADDLRALHEALFGVLSFVRGMLVGIALPTGYGVDGALRWCEWSTTIVSPWHSPLTWFDPTSFDDVGGLIARWMSRSEDEFWRDVLRRAMRITVSANSPDPVDTSIPAAFTGLELLAWAVLSIDEKWLRDGDGELNAAGRMRLLMRWAGIDTELPPELAELRTYAGGASDLDIPTALTFVRNRLVHPPRKPAAGWPASDVLIEAWRIALELLELVILRVLDYEGNYGHRRHLSGRWHGDTEPVPWARPS